MFQGTGFSMTPESFFVVFTSTKFPSFSKSFQISSQANSFNSQTSSGKLQFTVPSLSEIFGSSMDFFLGEDSLTFTLGLFDSENNEAINCPSASANNCRLVMTRSMTPILAYQSPRVIFDTAETGFYIDAKSAQMYKASTENFFTEATVNSQTIDFQDYIDLDTTIWGWTRTQIKGQARGSLPSANPSVNFKFKAGDALHDETLSTVCSVDGTSCYKAKVVPVIKSISQQSGFTSGHQTIKVEGFGFSAGLLEVTIDDVVCKVISSSLESFTCETGENQNPSDDTQYPGLPGLKRRYYESESSLSYTSMAAATPKAVLPLTGLETLQNQKDSPSGNIIDGYFRAPVTGNYKFYMSCDDICRLSLSTVNLDPSAATNIITISGAVGYRSYLTTVSRQSAWIPLTAGQYYYIKTEHIQGWGGDHLTVSVEIQGTNAVNHPNSVKEIQRLQISQDLLRDTFRITIDTPIEANTCGVRIVNGSSTSPDRYQADPLQFSCKATATQMRSYLSNYFNNYLRAAYTVTATYYDSPTNLTETGVWTETARVVYTVTTLKSLPYPAVQTLVFSIVGASTVMSFQSSNAIQRSSAPLSGNFRIECIYEDGTPSLTTAIPAGASPAAIRDRIVVACPFLRDKLEVFDGVYSSSYYVDGRDIMIRFASYNKNPAQFRIVNDTDSPLVDRAGFLNSTTVVAASGNLFYEPIPFELLFYAETKPSIKVSVDGLPAVCAGNLDCTFTYQQANSLITSFSLSGTTLTVNGNNFNTTELERVLFSNNEGTILSSSESQIVYELNHITAGEWYPDIISKNGIIPVDLGVSLYQKALTVTGVSPSTGINIEGDNILTISGSNFPTAVDGVSTVSVTFSDNSVCTIISTSETEITCKTSKFTATGTVTAILLVNGQVQSSISITVASAPAQIVSVSPSTVSPVLKTELTLQVNPGYTGTLAKADLQVYLQHATDAKITKAVNVISVDNSAKTILVKYGGAYSGVYNIVVKSLANGKFSASGVQITAIGKVTDFSPKQGSIYGGTLITITGYNFSTDGLDNNVRIGKTDCIVESSSNTQITCRTLPKVTDSSNVMSNKETLMVFLKLSEEAVCETSTGLCDFTWLSSNGIANLISSSVDWSTTANDYQLTLIGTGFPNTVGDIIFKIDGQSQSIVSPTSTTEIVITLNNLQAPSSTNIELYFPAGSPSGIEALLSTGITVTPRLVSITPSTGSPAGSIITAVVKGVGVATKDVVLTQSSNVWICTEVTIPSYGVVKCKTNATTIATANSLRVKVGSSIQQCANTGFCNYQTSTSTPAFSSLSISGNSLIITGTNFYTTGYTAKTLFAGAEATTTTINSATQVTATWTNGVPRINTASLPSIEFVGASESHWASGTATIANALTVSSIASSIQCSFQGGCEVSIAQVGLLSSFSSDLTSLKVCGVAAELNAAASTSSSVKLTVPRLATTYSVDNFKIAEESYLVGNPFSSSTNADLAKTVFDKDDMNGFTDTTQNPCFVGTKFTAGHVGFVTEVKFFLRKFVKSQFIGVTKFQGSNNDGSTYTDIFTFGDDVHEGWNYYTFEGANALKYNSYRFSGNTANSCLIGEIGLRGVEVIESTSSSYASCPIQLSLNGGTAITLSGTVTYSGAKTAKVTQISPRFGKVQGGEIITFTGSNFGSSSSDVSIKLDGITCVVQTFSSTQVTCLTGSRPGLYPTPTIDFSIAGQGKVATQGLIFRYVNYWSYEATWGNEFIPMEGDSLNIPAGLHLYVDVDATPKLNAVIVEGSLIFAPESNANHLRTFDASYVMIRGGYMEVGTEQFPYTSKLIITMHGSIESPEIPIYGNKVIAVRHGQLEMHGVPRTPTWTELETTVLAGATTITLHTAVDWQAGEVIVIAPTGYNVDEAEERTIVSVDRTTAIRPVITLDKKLQFKHYAGVETYGSETLEMRAEVGLLTRNVVYRGDPETSAKNQYGAHIMLHSHGDESLIGRFEYCEFRDVGQAFQLGRYPIHFHRIGIVTKSYIRGNAIHHTYNRAVTFHAVHQLRVQNNVAFETMGHTFFIEDAIETMNVIENNLAVKAKSSWSLLNTDQSPASFWITHPNNIFKGNHAAGSDRYGFWFDLQTTSIGPSFSTSICPENSPLGEFSDNSAHSNGRYGLRIFHNFVPRTFPCSPIVFDATNTTDPYWRNPLITAEFTNFRGWKNNRNGAIAERVGDIRFKDFQVADNLLAGIEFSLTAEVGDGHAQINGALIVGNSANADQMTNAGSQHGIITPRTENFQVHNAKFYNFNLNDQAALGSCSHCFHSAATDSGARTVTFSGLYFHPTSVTKKIRYQYPFRDIYYDLDGTLTGKGVESWATNYWEHNVQPECSVDTAVYDGILCTNAVQIRRVAMSSAVPATLFNLMELKVLKIDDSILSSKTETQKTEYYADPTEYSLIPFKPKLDPMNGWAVPFVTNHKYKIHWRHGLDFTSMRFDLSSRWETSDSNLYLVHNFTDVRAKVEFQTGGLSIENGTLLSDVSTAWETGHNVVYNETVREIHFAINGKNPDKKSLTVVGSRCIGPCLAQISEEGINNTVIRWSDPNSWTNNNKTVPLAGAVVIIESSWNMLLDIEVTPIFSMLQVNGRITFEDTADKDIHLRSKYIFVRAGEIRIGTEATPYNRTARITLFGEKENQHIVYSNAVEAGNKVLANTNKIRFYGKPRDSMSRLAATSQVGSRNIKVEAGLDWVQGDKLAIAPSSMRFNDTDQATIVSYNAATGDITLNAPLRGIHYGALVSTAPDYSGIDIRTEVALLTRNIKISGEDIEAWGCQIVTSDFVEFSGNTRLGSTVMDNVEIFNCSQYDTEKAALRFDHANGGFSSISNSVIRNGLGWGVAIQTSDNIHIKDNVIVSFVKMGLNINSANNVTIDGNFILDVSERQIIALDGMMDIVGGLISCAYIPGDFCTGISIINNIVAGIYFYGYAAYGHDCGDTTSNNFRNNTAHSIDGVGATIFQDPASPSQQTCLQGSNYTAYKVTIEGVTSYYSYNEIIYSDMVFIDNAMGPTPLVGKEADNLTARLQNIKMYGESPSRDCFYENECKKRSGPGCIDRIGLMLPYFSTGGKDVLIKKRSKFPVHKVKSDGSWGGVTISNDLEFINFESSTHFCGVTQRAIELNPYGADYNAQAKFYNVKFTDVATNATAHIFSPPSGWANSDDCGNFPCSAPLNALLIFRGTTFKTKGVTSSQSGDFEVVANNALGVSKFDSCNLVSTWNAYKCSNENLGILLFESLDGDKRDRMVTPIYVENANLRSSNKLNTYMDHVWDGFYTGQVRLSRFPSIVQVGDDMTYTVKYTGTPPENQRFTLLAEASSIVVRIDYPKAGVYRVLNSQGDVVPENIWVTGQTAPNAIQRTQCGENRFVGVTNILEFYLTANCTLTIQPVDQIRVKVRMDWTLEAFFASGGTTKFADRLAASLGIHASNIKIVAVYQGSVIVDFAIIQSAINAISDLPAVVDTLNEKIKSKNIFLGGKILSASIDTSSVEVVKNDGEKGTTFGTGPYESCHNLASKFSNAENGETITCASNFGTCVSGGTVSNGQCSWTRRTYASCTTESDGKMKISIESNGLPNQCYHSESNAPVTQNYDFQMYYAPYGTSFSIQSFSTQAAVDAQLCSAIWATSSSVNAQIQLSDTSSSNTDKIVGISLIGVPFFTGTYEAGYDFIKPKAYSNFTIPIELEVDNCLGVTIGGVYRFHSYSHCIFSVPSIAPKKCQNITECNSNPITYALSQTPSEFKTLKEIGIAKDGRVIYGPYKSRDSIWQPCDVDMCNGATILGIYSYVTTVFHPYTVGCWGPGKASVKGLVPSCSTNPRKCSLASSLMMPLGIMLMLLFVLFQ